MTDDRQEETKKKKKKPASKLTRENLVTHVVHAIHWRQEPLFSELPGLGHPYYKDGKRSKGETNWLVQNM